MRHRDRVVIEAASSARLGSRGFARARCPFCPERTGKEDKKGCFWYRLGSGRWGCWRCGAGGRVESPPEELRAPETEQVEVVESFEPPEGYWPLCEEPGASAVSLAPARAYLFGPRPDGRGVSPEVAAEVGIGACSIGRWAGRIIVPARDEGGIWLGWSGRAWLPGVERPYLYPPGMARGALLWNHAALLRETEEWAYAAEGVFDALPFWPDAAAFLGKPSGKHVDALVASRRPVVVLLDGDSWREAEALSLRLRFDGQRAGYVRLPPKVDPDEAPRSWVVEEARRCLDAA